tara:strand:+ start:147 stop:524 length:378 start_codon:yes stop_codon:yes gene_type:complete
MLPAYQVVGLTKALTATATSSGTSFTPAECNAAFSGTRGPYYLKITNGSAADNIFFVTDTTAPTAVIPTAGTPGSCAIPAYGEVIVQIAGAGGLLPVVPVYIAVVAANSSPVYVTPVLLAAFVGP